PDEGSEIGTPGSAPLHPGLYSRHPRGGQDPVRTPPGVAGVKPRVESSEPGDQSPSPPAPLPALRERGDLFSLRGLRALVTGSTSGIGRAIARAFAAAGADVVVHGRRSAGTAAAVAAELAALGVRSRVLMADLRDPAAGRQLVAAAWDVCGGLDAVVLNAGADTLTGPAAGWPFERKLAELLAVDVTSTMLLARDAGGRMKQQGRGVIL